MLKILTQVNLELPANREKKERWVKQVHLDHQGRKAKRYRLELLNNSIFSMVSMIETHLFIWFKGDTGEQGPVGEQVLFMKSIVFWTQIKAAAIRKQSFLQIILA